MVKAVSQSPFLEFLPRARAVPAVGSLKLKEISLKKLGTLDMLKPRVGGDPARKGCKGLCSHTVDISHPSAGGVLELQGQQGRRFTQ